MAGVMLAPHMEGDLLEKERYSKRQDDIGRHGHAGGLEEVKPKRGQTYAHDDVRRPTKPKCPPAYAAGHVEQLHDNFHAFAGPLNP